jgi:hypothetical protein
MPDVGKILQFSLHGSVIRAGFEGGEMKRVVVTRLRLQRQSLQLVNNQMVIYRNVTDRS